uniref:Uncharacterized protein n=1 Tax=Romanomermis culicivorax TaxID=13658 RepID=A0A915HZW3_ROMCU
MKSEPNAGVPDLGYKLESEFYELAPIPRIGVQVPPKYKKSVQASWIHVLAQVEYKKISSEWIRQFYVFISLSSALQSVISHSSAPQ